MELLLLEDIPLADLNSEITQWFCFLSGIHLWKKTEKVRAGERMKEIKMPSF